MLKNLPANEGDVDSTPGSGRCPGGGNGHLLSYFCLENPTDREAWWATVHGVAKSRTRLSDVKVDVKVNAFTVMCDCISNKVKVP